MALNKWKEGHHRGIAMEKNLGTSYSLTSGISYEIVC